MLRSPRTAWLAVLAFALVAGYFVIGPVFYINAKSHSSGCIQLVSGIARRVGHQFRAHSRKQREDEKP